MATPHKVTKAFEDETERRLTYFLTGRDTMVKCPEDCEVCRWEQAQFLFKLLGSWRWC